MKQIIFISLLIAVLFSACEKDTDYSNQKEIISFIFEELTPKVTATIDETDGTISRTSFWHKYKGINTYYHHFCRSIGKPSKQCSYRLYKTC